MQIDKVTNLLLNTTSGLLPEHFSKEEVKLIEIEFGENWFEELGYSEPEYNKPVGENNGK